MQKSLSWFNTKESWRSRAAAWAFEIAGEAVGTSLLMLISAFWIARDQPPTKYGSDWIGFVFFIPAILYFFTVTGYVLTTALCRILWKNRSHGYASVAALLYMLHSQMIFLSLKTPRDQSLYISLGGAVITFGCASAGNALLAHWYETNYDIEPSQVQQ